MNECDHIIGALESEYNGIIWLSTESDKKFIKKAVRLFFYCPDCGSKLDE